MDRACIRALGKLFEQFRARRDPFQLIAAIPASVCRCRGASRNPSNWIQTVGRQYSLLLLLACSGATVGREELIAKTSSCGRRSGSSRRSARARRFCPRRFERGRSRRVFRGIRRRC